MSKPPFELTEKIINLVAEITIKITNLEAKTNFRKDLYLRKVSKIKSVNSSCAIEANTLSIEEVTSVINGKKVLAPLKEITEVQNAYNAYINIDTFNQYSVKSFLEAHKLLTSGLIKESGKFRLGDVGVFDGNKVIHMGARPDFVPKLIEELFAWAEVSELHPLIKSSVIHFEIEFIHPFNDGNGRIGRLWQALLLYKYNKIFEYVPIETLVYENQQEYYDSLAQSEIEGKTMDSVELSNLIDKTYINYPTITFIIGGSYGIHEDVKKRSDFSLSFSKLTFPHQLFRVMLIEQIYRVFKINKNESYHK